MRDEKSLERCANDSRLCSVSINRLLALVDSCNAPGDQCGLGLDPRATIWRGSPPVACSKTRPNRHLGPATHGISRLDFYDMATIHEVVGSQAGRCERGLEYGVALHGNG